jgi:hypothetical protein
MDCGIEGRACNVFKAVTAKYPVQGVLPLPGFPDSVAVGHKSLSDFSAYGHFGHWYFEMTIAGYQTADSASTFLKATTLLNYYRQKSGL